MFGSTIGLSWDLFPAPGPCGVEYLASVAGRNAFWILVFFAAVWALDAMTERLRGVCGDSRLGRLLYFALSVALFAGAAIVLFHLWFWTKLPVCRWAAQGIANLALQEVGIAMIAAALPALALASAWPALRRAPRWLRAALALLAAAVFAAAAWWCWRHYGVARSADGRMLAAPRVRDFALAWRECVALFALWAVALVAAVPSLLHAPRGWKRAAAALVWIVVFACWAQGVASVRAVPLLARVSAGTTLCDAPAGLQAPSSKAPAAPFQVPSSKAPSAPFDLAAAIAAARPGAEILVPPGVYPPISTGGKRLVIRALEGPGKTVIDATGSRCRAATLAPPRLVARLERLVARAQRAHVLQLPNLLPRMGEGRSPAEAPPGGATRLVGFTLRGGYADCGGNALGGTLEDCVLEGGAAEFCGGGAFGSRLVRCNVRRNVAGWLGGGLFGGSTEGCTVEGNAAGDFGGGVWGGVHAGLSASGNEARFHPDEAATAAAR